MALEARDRVVQALGDVEHAHHCPVLVQDWQVAEAPFDHEAQRIDGIVAGLDSHGTGGHDFAHEHARGVGALGDHPVGDVLVSQDPDKGARRRDDKPAVCVGTEHLDGGIDDRELGRE